MRDPYERGYLTIVPALDVKYPADVMMLEASAEINAAVRMLPGNLRDLFYVKGPREMREHPLMLVSEQKYFTFSLPVKHFPISSFVNRDQLDAVWENLRKLLNSLARALRKENRTLTIRARPWVVYHAGQAAPPWVNEFVMDGLEKGRFRRQKKPSMLSLVTTTFDGRDKMQA